MTNSCDTPSCIERGAWTLSPNTLHRYYFKSTRQSSESNDAPRRFVLQPGALPPGARLSASLGELRGCAAARELPPPEEEQSSGAAAADALAEDFADVVLLVEGRGFRWDP